MAVIDELPIYECEKRHGWSGNLISYFVRLRALVQTLSEGSGIIFDNGSRALVTDSTGAAAESAVTAAEILHLDGVTSSIQDQIDAKQATITGAATTIDTEDLTVSRAVVSNGAGKVAVSATTAAEIVHVSGVTSAIQTQLDAKYAKAGGPISGPVTFTGTGRIDWTKKTANGVTLSGFTSASTASDLQTAHDGNVYVATEVAATAGQNVVVDFTGVTAFNWVQILCRYAGSSAHVISIQLEITPFDGSAWHEYGVITDQPADYTMEEHSFFIPDDAPYINSGVVKVRFVHPSGVNGHTLNIDVVALYQ